LKTTAVATMAWLPAGSGPMVPTVASAPSTNRAPMLYVENPFELALIVVWSAASAALRSAMS
jgi:hypothetical protein